MDQYAHIQARLIEKQNELTRRLERLKENLTAGRSADSQEQAQELENAEVVDALGNEARTEISRIAKALDQIKNGNLRRVASTAARTIPMARLEALPFRRSLHPLRDGRGSTHGNSRSPLRSSSRACALLPRRPERTPRRLLPAVELDVARALAR